MNSRDIKASDLRERVTLRKPVKTANTFNEAVVSYADVESVYAEVEEGGGKEFYASDQLRNEKRIRIKIWLRTDITTEWRFVWDGREFEIDDISQIQPRRGLIINGFVKD